MLIFHPVVMHVHIKPHTFAHMSMNVFQHTVDFIKFQKTKQT